LGNFFDFNGRFRIFSGKIKKRVKRGDEGCLDGKRKMVKVERQSKDAANKKIGDRSR
jgi:hypothetical protein